MKLVNKSARPYSIHGVFVIPGGEITLDDNKLPDVQLFIDIGDLVEMAEEVKQEVVEVKDDEEIQENDELDSETDSIDSKEVVNNPEDEVEEVKQEKKKPGRKPKVQE